MASSNGKSLSIDEILAADDVVVESVSCPEWGGTVYLRSICSDLRDDHDQRFMRDEKGQQDLVGMRRTLVGMCLCDSAGNAAAITPSQIIALGKKSSGAMDRCYAACQRINSMGPHDIEAAGKNSDPAAAGDSG